MKRRKLHHFTRGQREAKVYWHSATAENIVAFYEGGRKLTWADYFTDSLDDAVQTAQSWVRV